jgi:hypothetical protein
MDEFNLEKGIVLIFDNESKLEMGRKNIIFIPVWKWIIKNELT